VRSHVTFAAADTAQVDAFHTAAVARRWAGLCPPGERPYAGYYYAAVVLDPDGHNVEVVFHGDESRR
jgi:predicted lactoylglutathione lyase